MAGNAYQVSCPTSQAQELAGADAGRRTLIIKNLDSANPIFYDFNNPSVTTSTGMRLDGGGVLTLTDEDATFAWYAIAQTAAVNVAVLPIKA